MECEPDNDDNTVFPSLFPDVGGECFKYVFENRAEWVTFTLEMSNCTGFFAVWKSYCIRKSK